MEYLLVVMFYINGSLTFVEGFLPLAVENARECEARREFFDMQFNQDPNAPPYHLACYKMIPEGESL